MKMMKYVTLCLAAAARCYCAELMAIEIPEDACLVCDMELGQDICSDKYTEAYIQGVVDTKYSGNEAFVHVRNGSILLTQLPENEAEKEDMIQFVRQITHKSTYAAQPVSEVLQQQENPRNDMLLPQSTMLFPSQVANPRQSCFSLGSRFGDKIGGKIASEITIGGQFPTYRWVDVYNGDVQLDLEGAVFAVFDMKDSTFPMINADYYAGVPLSYAYENWAFRLRPYHVSSHLGDEYMVKHRHIHRKNKSFEALDLFADYSLTKNLRIYGGVGVVLASDNEYAMKRFYCEYGGEIRGEKTVFKQLYRRPFCSVHIQHWQVTHGRLDVSCAAGYEWGKTNDIGRKIRLFFEAHEGLSPEGQFCHKRTHYLGLRLAYGF